YYTLLTWPMMAIGWVTLLVSRGRVSARRINAIFAERVSKSLTASAGDNATNIKGDIEFRGVGFGFEPGKPILHNISFRVQAGSVLGITGPVGAGKSTIANLLLRLEEPASGEILIDGKPVGDYEANSLRAAIGYVPQETFLFSETVAQNIAFGAPGAQREQVAEAAELAGVSGEIANLPKGYDTMLGERGVNLSGGQKQRLAIARALAGRPRIVVVDDCLSAVDTKTEEHILRSLKEQLAGCTVIMISQRVTSIAHAGEIIVLDRGRIVERGTHETLRTADGLYATLAQRQEVSAKVE
ncbi:MAG: ABC transporter ATP-binding protein/permease, partial [Planctomycetes bacterium]|nr:ABC transporter ATP-binding protein/permease [Planctomycetota bacterium]